jgi:hypothetical protein
MGTDMELDELLNQLRSAVLSSMSSRKKVLSVMEVLLSWLNKPENNTDSNCRRVDYFVSYEIMPEARFKELPEDIRGILFDMGATLHDTHTSPQIAENFESTPSQLLDRVRKLIK